MKYTEESIQEFLSSIEINDQVNIGKKVIGSNFKRMRRDAGLTQKNIADYLKIAPQNIYKFEKGERSFEYSYEALKNWSYEILEMNGVNLVESGIRFGVRNTIYPVFFVSFPKKKNSKVIQKFIENNFELSQRKYYIERKQQEIVLAILSKEL
ncbi:TPA: helix-turn-helix domain-containing protein [Enterococcus faecalis]